MGDIFQRNSMMLGTPQVAPISLGQYGLPRPDLSAMNSAGGLPLPNLGITPEPAQNFLSSTEMNALMGSGAGAGNPDRYGAFGAGGINRGSAGFIFGFPFPGPRNI